MYILYYIYSCFDGDYVYASVSKICDKKLE